MMTMSHAQDIQLYLEDDVNCDPVKDAYIEYGDSSVFSDNYGLVRLNKNHPSPKPTTVFIAAEGYERRSVRLDYSKNNIYEIRLHPAIYRFDDVVIAVNRLEDTLVLSLIHI